MRILAALSLVILLAACDAPATMTIQYEAEIYPELGDEDNYIYLGKFSSRDDCEIAAIDALEFYEQKYDTEGLGTYDCHEE